MKKNEADQIVVYQPDETKRLDVIISVGYRVCSLVERLVAWAKRLILLIDSWIGTETLERVESR